MKRMGQRILLGCLALGIGSGAMAHTGHATDGLFAGLLHPLATDHLLAMLAVGVWSVAALPAARRLWGPVVFLLGLLVGALLGTVTGQLGAALELALAATLALFAALLLAPRALPGSLVLALVAVAAALHGLAHGAELPAGAAFGSYAAGLLVASALLQACGLGLGAQMLRARAWAWRALAAALGVAAWALMPLV